jgi:hypothetical protein
MKNRKTGRGTVFNWGIFDFSNPVTFSWNFYKGVMLYRLAAYPLSAELPRYQLEHRTIFEDKLNFTNEQKEILIKRLQWHTEPSNLIYQYNYFFDNCSTRPRDYIDEALGGIFKSNWANQYVNKTFRESMREHLDTLPGIDLFLDIVMNSNLDRPMSYWELAYLPLSLRELLLNTTNTAKNEGPSPLVSESRKLFSYLPKAPTKINGHQLFLVLTGGALIAAAALRKKATKGTKQLSLQILGLLLLCCYFYLGIIGLLMPLNWTLSDHIDLHHNVNMLFFWPTDLIYVLIGYRMLRTGAPPQFRTQGSRLFFTYYQLAHLVVAGLTVVVAFFGGIKQDIRYITLYLLPTLSLIWLFLGTKGIGSTTRR